MAARKLKGISLRQHRVSRLPRAAARRAKRQLGSKSFSRFARKALTELGFTADEIEAVAHGAPAVPLKRLTAPFRECSNWALRRRRSAPSGPRWRTFANRHALGR